MAKATYKIEKYRGIGGFLWMVSTGRGRNFKRIGDFRSEEEAQAAALEAEKSCETAQ